MGRAFRSLFFLLIGGMAWSQDVVAAAQDPRWRALLHVAPSWRGERSVVDDPAFFLAAEGPTDPRAELEANLAALQAPAVAGQPHFIDRFPARARFLCETFAIPRSSLPVPRAEACETALAAFQGRSATLVFASGYLAAPASWFGHTLVVVRGRYDSLALAQAVNYAATTPTTNGLEFAARGLFGGYDGHYSLLPYHRKIAEYADIDQRDLWEYDLSFTTDEVDWLLRHAWELRGIVSTYWFVDENCSWRLLFLLDVARPSAGLRARWAAWTLPIDTVRQVQATGLTAPARHRPSRRSRVLAELAALSPEDRTRALALADDGEDPGPGSARVLEAAANLLATRLAAGDVELPVYQRRLLAITAARSRLPPQDPVPVPAPPSPERGHGTLRLELAMGRVDGVATGRLTARAALHDLTDPLEGFDAGTQVEFARGDVRWSHGHGVRLAAVDAVAVTSLAPVDALGLRPSYRLAAGWRDEGVSGRRAALAAGSGITLGAGAHRVAGLVEGEARMGVRHPTGAFGLGPTVLATTAWGPVRATGELAVHPGIVGQRQGHGGATGTLTWSGGRWWALRVSATRERIWGQDSRAAFAGLAVYW